MTNRPCLSRRCRRRAVSVLAGCGWLALLGVNSPAAEPTDSLRPVQLSEAAAPDAIVADLGHGAADWRWELADVGPEFPFTIHAETGVVTLAPHATLDFETQPRWECRAIAVAQRPVDPAEQLFAADLQDSGVSDATAQAWLERRREVPLVVDLLDAPEAPRWSDVAAGVLRFDLSQPLREYTLRAIDPDAADPLRYEIVAGDDDRRLHCDPATGRLSLAAGDVRAWPHGFAEQRLQVAVRATDSHGLATEQVVQIAVSDPVSWFTHELAVAETAPLTVAAASPLVQTATSEINETPPPSAAASAAAPPPAVVTLTAARGLAGTPLSRADDSLTTDRRAMHMVLACALVAVCLLGLAAVASAVLRRRKRQIVAASAGGAADEIHTGRPILPEAVARNLSLSASPTRSLRAEMSELLAVSQHFTLTQRAHTERRFHGRQFRLAAIATVAAAGIILLQSLFGLDHAFHEENLLVFGCVCVATAAALRALFGVRQANDRIKQGGPMSGQFQLDKPTAA